MSEWRSGRIEDFFVLQRGFDITQSEAKEGSIPVISSSGFSYYHCEAKVKGPGVVTGRKGRVGPVYFIEEVFGRMTRAYGSKTLKATSQNSYTTSCKI